ncbi:MAG TPA: phytanoyl-CoA dioxygenase family protein [Gammaproteobacteria bacterium]|nr:phytanoyl-CoA dioxygenase family protein [Gammaproteobacteria bacterium]
MQTNKETTFLSSRLNNIEALHHFYLENGYFFLNTHLANRFKQLREKFVHIWDLAFQVNTNECVKNDADIIRLYQDESLRKVWFAGYDQTRQLPELYTLLDNDTMQTICCIAGIKLPAFTNPITTRIDLPYGQGSRPTLPHQDYPTHQGSLNSITVWIPLQDVSRDNGTTELLPGSHLGGMIDEADDLNNFIEPGTLRKVENPHTLEDIAGYVPATLKLGQILVFSLFTLHRSGLNRSNHIRFTLNIRYNDLHSKEYAKRFFYSNYKGGFKRTTVDFPTRFETN